MIISENFNKNVITQKIYLSIGNIEENGQSFTADGTI